MTSTWKTALVTIVIGMAAFIAGPQLWPPGADVPHPPTNLMPAYIFLAALEALAFGLAIAFAFFGWPKVRDIPLPRPWLNRVLHVSIVWLLGNWWIHDGLHIHIGLDMSRLVYIEYGFHATLLACGAVLAVAFMSSVGSQSQPNR